MKQVILCIFVSMGCLSCATFRSNTLDSVERYQLKPNENRKTKVFQNWTIEMTGTKDALVAAAVNGIARKRLEDALIQTGCCEMVTSSSDAEITIEGIQYFYLNYLDFIPALITGVTLYIVPSWKTSEVRVSVTVQKAGAPRKIYDVQDSNTLVQWLPMIFAYPFTESPYKADELLAERVFDNVVLRLKQDGLIF